jgi:hypothetical protein
MASSSSINLQTTSGVLLQMTIYICPMETSFQQTIYKCKSLLWMSIHASVHGHCTFHLLKTTWMFAGIICKCPWFLISFFYFISSTIWQMLLNSVLIVNTISKTTHRSNRTSILQELYIPIQYDYQF